MNWFITYLKSGNIFGLCYVYAYDIIFLFMTISVCVHTMIFNFEIEGYFAYIYVCVFDNIV
ncbi:Transcription factor PDR8 [Gossypium arboreum]|uniref:Transcription factor PDR8 n=1 Tax=Gossypium arboreum TaxID=29729 RepID=A0A0B0PX76_GOSAR|nr:Transcription factor PDR8 [Gossypium arboreum]